VDAVGTALRIEQTWSMFAPNPPTVTSQYELHRTLPDGSHLVEPANPNFRWTIYLDRVGNSPTPDHPQAQSLRRFALRHCSDGSLDVGRVEIRAQRREVHEDGRSTPTSLTLVDVPCPDE
jgi:hypothetical protein